MFSSLKTLASLSSSLSSTLYSYVPSTNADVFTVKGIDKLNALKVDLEKLAINKELGKGRSEYSKKMVNSAIEAIELLVKNNSLMYWYNKNNQQQLKSLINILDNSTGTYLPEVFNTESKMLVDIFIKHLSDNNVEFNLDEYVQSHAMTLISALADHPKLISAMKKNMEFKARLYNWFADNYQATSVKDENQMTNFAKLGKKIQSTFDQLNEEANGSIPDYAKFKEKYKMNMLALANEINQMPYVQILHVEKFVNADKPYMLSSNDKESLDINADVQAQDLRATLIGALLTNESNINHVLKEKNMEPLSEIYHLYQSKYSEDAFNSIKDELNTVVVAFKIKSEEYKTGGHLRNSIFSLYYFNAVDPDKINVIDQLKEKITDLGVVFKQNKTIWECAFDGFKETLSAQHTNALISSQKNISIGELSKILNNFCERFIGILFKMNETCDPLIFELLKKCNPDHSLENSSNHTQLKM